MKTQIAVIDQIMSVVDGAASKIEGLIQTTYRNHDIHGLSLATTALASLSGARLHLEEMPGGKPNISVAADVTPKRRGRRAKALVLAVEGHTKRAPGRPRKISSDIVETKRRPGRPTSGQGSGRVLTAKEKLRRKSINNSTAAGELTGSKTYRPYLLTALRKADTGKGAEFVTVQNVMHDLMKDVMKPNDEAFVAGTSRPRWMYQTSALRNYLLTHGLIIQVGDNSGSPLYSITQQGIEELNTTSTPIKKRGRPRKLLAA